MNLSDIRNRLAGLEGRAYWRSLEELADTPAFNEYLHREFPANASEFTDPAGRFGFRFAADTASVFLLSARYAGIEYFSRPARATAGRPDTGLVILVADTSSSAPVRLAGRYLMIGRPEQAGRRGALDLIVLQNRGTTTRVARDSTMPDVFLPACLTPGATGVMVVHNHPSGDPTPSPDDARLTLRLCAAADVLDIALLDHLIVGDEGRYFSFHESGQFTKRT